MATPSTAPPPADSQPGARNESGDIDRIFDAIISRSIRHRRAALAALLCLLAAGVAAARRLPMDVMPDISSVQVQVLTAVPDLSPEESEKAVTRPLELELAGSPRLREVRSLTRFGVSQIVLTFDDGTDLYRARQAVTERLATATDRIPRGLSPRLSPPSTGLGEIFTYAVAYKAGQAPIGTSLEERLRRLKTLQDFMVKPALWACPGLAEVNTTGGHDRQLLVEPNLARLGAVGMDLNDLVQVLQRNTAVGGGALVERDGRQSAIRSLARTQTTDDVAAACLRLSWGAAPVSVAELAKVRIGSAPRLGAATLNGAEAVLGTALMVAGGNARKVAADFRTALDSAQKRLPPEVEIIPLYDRGELVNEVVNTISVNLLTSAALVVVVLFVFLGGGRASLVVAAILLASFSLGLIGMTAWGVVGTLASLGAMDFGVVVDDTVVMAENVARRLASPVNGDSRDRLAAVGGACRQVRKPMLAGMLLIIAAYLPVFALTGVEGRMFRPLAQAVVLTLASSLFLTVTLGPGLCALLMGGAQSREPRFLGACRERLALALDWARRRRPWVIGATALLAAGAVGLATRLGADFVPSLDEGWLVVEVQRDPHTGLEASVALELESERAVLAAIPEVRLAFARIGMSEIATDPQGPHQNDIYIAFKPRSEWRRRGGRGMTKAELAAEIEKTLRDKVPNQAIELNQPISVRFDEMLEGVRSDLAVKLYGPDMDSLERLAARAAEIARATPGVEDVTVDLPGRIQTWEYEPDRGAMLRFQAVPDQINNAISIGLQGREAGRIDEGNAFYPLVVRLAEPDRTNVNTLNQLILRAADGTLILGLAQLGHWRDRERVASISREQGERRIAVQITVKGAAESYAKRLLESLDREAPVPKGFRREVTGSYQRLDSGVSRLISGAAGLAIIGAVLVAAVLGSWRQAACVLSGAPLAMLGGVFGLWMRDLPLTMPAAVGLLSLSGLSLLNGLVLSTHFNELCQQGLSSIESAAVAAQTRLRPVLMTALVAAVGLAPMLLSDAAGAEIQRPFATVVTSGVVVSTVLTLVVLPLLLGGFGVRRSDAVS